MWRPVFSPVSPPPPQPPLQPQKPKFENLRASCSFKNLIFASFRIDSVGLLGRLGRPRGWGGGRGREFLDPSYVGSGGPMSGESDDPVGCYLSSPLLGVGPLGLAADAAARALCLLMQQALCLLMQQVAEDSGKPAQMLPKCSNRNNILRAGLGNGSPSPRTTPREVRRPGVAQAWFLTRVLRTLPLPAASALLPSLCTLSPRRAPGVANSMGMVTHRCRFCGSNWYIYYKI